MRTTRSSTEFAGKVALVTGASSFLATAVITQLVEAGARVVLADVNEEICSEIAQSLGESVRFVRTDVTIDADLERLVDTAGSGTAVDFAVTYAWREGHTATDDLIEIGRASCRERV